MLKLKDFRKVRELAKSENVEERIQAAKSPIATKTILKELSNDEDWLVRLYVVMNNNVSEDILLEMKKRETELAVCVQINSELAYIENIKKIRG